MTATQPHTSAPPTRGPRHRRRWPRARNVLAWSLRRLLALAALALAGTAALDARDRRRPPPGELVELPDGRVLHLQVAGVEHDGPTVVLDAGQGLFSPAFAWLQADLAEHATVVAYDRPGYGWSTPTDRPVDATATVGDLHAALEARALPGPYLLVGHSLGAFYARTFADRYPEETLALALLDPAHEQQVEHLPPDALAEFEQAEGMLQWAARMARFGLFRLSNPQEAATVDLPATAADQIITVAAMAGYWHAAAAEVEAFERLGATPPHDFGDRPVMVISAGRDVPGRPPVREAMDDLHQDLVARSPLATHHVIEEADHLTMLTVEEYARQVAELVADLLSQDRP